MTQKELRLELWNKTKMKQSEINFVMDCLEEIIFDQMSKGGLIKLVQGVTFESFYTPKREIKSNLFHKTYEIPPKMVPTARFSKKFVKKINEKEENDGDKADI